MAIAYFEQYPDVGASYAQNNYGLSPEEYANFHFENYGRNEKRISPQVAEIAVAGATGGGTQITPTYTPVASAYFAQNPDVEQAYRENNYGLTPDEFANTHYNLYGGTQEQRASPTIVEQISRGDLTALPVYFQQNPDVAAAYQQNTYGLTPEQFAAKHFELYGLKEKRVPPTGLTTTNVNIGTNTGVKTGVTTGINTGVNTGATSFVPLPSPAPITTPTTTVGQFRELFPSFEESKRLAGQMVANRPSTQSIINMIQSPTAATPTTTTPTTTTPISGGLPAYFTQNPDVAAAYANRFNDPNLANLVNLTPEQFANTHYNVWGQNENRAAPTITTTTPSLNNVLSMISK
jgi:hypothetical protein